PALHYRGPNAHGHFSLRGRRCRGSERGEREVLVGRRAQRAVRLAGRGHPEEQGRRWVELRGQDTDEVLRLAPVRGVEAGHVRADLTHLQGERQWWPRSGGVRVGDRAVFTAGAWGACEP